MSTNVDGKRLLESNSNKHRPNEERVKDFVVRLPTSTTVSLCSPIVADLSLFVCLGGRLEKPKTLQLNSSL
jgi:hypothetical protein